MSQNGDHEGPASGSIVIKENNPMKASNDVIKDGGEVDPNDLIVLHTCCCQIISCYLKFPDCIGCATNFTWFCYERNAICCKPHPNPKKICICCRDDSHCIEPTTCCKNICQCCCIDCRQAFPCDYDVPCGCGVCGLICCFNYKFAPKFLISIRTLREEAAANAK